MNQNQATYYYQSLLNHYLQTFLLQLTAMLKSGYFTNRNQIIEWVNSVLHIQMTKIQQLGSGNIFCHILDAAYPSKVPLHKVKWNAYLQIDFIYNFKILQDSFSRVGIDRNIQVQKLVKAKYQDNLQLIQWMKYQFSQQIKNNKMYNALKRRNNAVVFLAFNQTLAKSRSTHHLLTANKENHNMQNYCIGSPRVSFNTQRNIVKPIQRQSLPLQSNSTKPQSNQVLPSKGVIRRERLSAKSNRVHTEQGGLVFYQKLYTEFILEEDGEQYY